MPSILGCFYDSYPAKASVHWESNLHHFVVGIIGGRSDQSGGDHAVFKSHQVAAECSYETGPVILAVSR